jgi:hypothetical protein
MITILLLLGGILVIGLALAAELLRLAGATQSLDPVRWQRELSNPVVYRPMSRLFAREDFSFVASRHAGRGMGRRLRRSRAAVMALYLRQMRNDFHEVWALCRLLAPLSHDSELSVLLLRQFVLFHGLYFVLRLRCLTGWYGSMDFDITRLVGVLNQIRSSAGRALQTSQALALEPGGY